MSLETIKLGMSIYLESMNYYNTGRDTSYSAYTLIRLYSTQDKEINPMSDKEIRAGFRRLGYHSEQIRAIYRMFEKIGKATQ